MPKPLVIAHRGASVEAPENTMAAFRRAVDLGVDMIEFDVRRTADGHLVIFHDDTLNRITGTDGTIESKPLAELQGLDAGTWFGAAFAGERIPTLDHMLELAAGRVALDVEVKVPLDKRGRPELIQSLADTLRIWAGRIDMVVSSFDPELVQSGRPLLTPIPVCRIWGPDDAVTDEFGPVQPYAIVHGKLVTSELVQRVHAAQAKVWVWTLDEAAHMDMAWQAGVDGICSNHPACLLERRQHWGST